MFSRNKEGNPSIQSRKHKLIYNRINFAPSPSPWHCWIFCLEIPAAAALIAILSMSALSCKAGAGFVFIWVVLFTPVTAHSHPYNRWASLSNAEEKGGYSHRALREAPVLLSSLARHGCELREFLCAQKSSPGSCWGCSAWICLRDPTGTASAVGSSQRKKQTNWIKDSGVRCVLQFSLSSIDITIWFICLHFCVCLWYPAWTSLEFQEHGDLPYLWGCLSYPSHKSWYK